MRENYKASFSQDGKDYEAKVSVLNDNENLPESDKLDSVAEQVKRIANSSDCQEKIDNNDIKIVKIVKP